MIFVLSQGRLKGKNATMGMTDKIEKLNNSLIHHGKLSDRIYLMGLAPQDVASDFLLKLDDLVVKNNYSKIFAKVPASSVAIFLNNGYRQEAFVKKFFAKDDGYFISKYFNYERSKDEKQAIIDKVLATAKAKAEEKEEQRTPEHNYKIDKLAINDIPQIVEIYKQVFATYPFPIHNQSYIKETMLDNVIYFGIWDGNKIIAIASCEMNRKELNAEMTDFATLEEYRGQALASFLLHKMEKVMQQMGMQTLYTIARAYSFGMNITFAKNQYIYAGTLVKNTNISGQIESMNVWYKNLAIL